MQVTHSHFQKSLEAITLFAKPAYEEKGLVLFLAKYFFPGWIIVCWVALRALIL